ncbi:Uncharacterized protein TCAP_06350, partial [Tolypocladium capitatum]
TAVSPAAGRNWPESKLAITVSAEVEAKIRSRVEEATRLPPRVMTRNPSAVTSQRVNWWPGRATQGSHTCFSLNRQATNVPLHPRHPSILLLRTPCFVLRASCFVLHERGRKQLLTRQFTKLFSLRAIRPTIRSPSPLRRLHQPLRMASISAQTYTPTEEAEIQQWLTTSERLRAGEDKPSILETLNSHLANRTTLLGSKPSKADVAIYETLSPIVAKWSPDERTGEKGHPHIVRHLDFVQNSPQFGLALKDDQKFSVDQDDVRYVKPPVDAKAEKERLKKEKAATTAGGAGAGNNEETLVDRTKEKVKEKAAEVKEKAAEVKGAAAAAAAAVAGGDKPKKEKKEKAPKPQKAPAAAAPMSPALIDLRVGHILKAINHPDADSLYVSTIAMGDEASDDTTEYEGQVCRTVCSGLNGLIPLAEMQGRKVVVVCNLKPVKMRGIKSSAMVLAASPKIKEGDVDDHKGPVELVSPPEGAKAGERVFFEGWKGEPEGQLNPKKKIWEMFQPGFTTTDSLEVAFNAGVVEQLGKSDVGRLVTESGGVCTVKTLKDAVVR